MKNVGPTPTYGLLAEYDTLDGLIHGLERVKEAGYKKLDAFTPFPDHTVCNLVAERRSRVPLLVLIGGLTGAVLGFGMQVWVSVIDYPLNIGGRPLFSWPAFIPVTFETTILLGAFAAVFGMLALNGLPRPYHPVFNVASFERATTDRYFMLIEASDPRFDQVGTRAFLEGLGSREVSDVDW